MQSNEGSSIPCIKTDASAENKHLAPERFCLAIPTMCELLRPRITLLPPAIYGIIFLLLP